MLRDYLLEDIVSIVPWHYQHCDHKEVNPYTANYINPFPANTIHPSLSQRTALASCYARHRTLTRYMLSVHDIDHVVTLSRDVWSPMLDEFTDSIRIQVK